MVSYVNFSNAEIQDSFSLINKLLLRLGLITLTLLKKNSVGLSPSPTN